MPSQTATLAKRWFPDGRGDLDEEVRRYQMLRFGSFVGFKPPYFYHRELRERLYRASMPSLVVWGEHDRMVPPAHGAAYHDGCRKRRVWRCSTAPATRFTWSSRTASPTASSNSMSSIPMSYADSPFEAAAPA